MATEISVNNATSLISALNYALTKRKDERLIIYFTTNISLHNIAWPFGDKEFYNLEVDGNGYYIQFLNLSGERASLFGYLRNSRITSIRVREFRLTAAKEAACIAVNAVDSEILNIEVSKSTVVGDIAAGVVAVSERCDLNVIALLDSLTVAAGYVGGGAVGIAFRGTRVRNVQADQRMSGESAETWLGGVVGYAVTAGGQVVISSCAANVAFPEVHSRADAILARKIP